MDKKMNLDLTVGQLYYGRLKVFDRINPAYLDELTGEYETIIEIKFSIRPVVGIVKIDKSNADRRFFRDLIKRKTYPIFNQSLHSEKHNETFVFSDCELIKLYSEPIFNPNCPITQEVIDEIETLLKQRGEYIPMTDQIRQELHERHPDLFLEPEDTKILREKAKETTRSSGLRNYLFSLLKSIDPYMLSFIMNDIKDEQIEETPNGVTPTKELCKVYDFPTNKEVIK